METYHWLFLAAIAAAAVPFVLAYFGLDDYDNNGGISVEDWKKPLGMADPEHGTTLMPELDLVTTRQR